MATKFHPERLGSTDTEHFCQAYRNRLLLNALVFGIYISILAIGGLSAWLLLNGHFLASVKAFGIVGLLFVCWYLLHNWALTHPKR